MQQLHLLNENVYELTDELRIAERGIAQATQLRDTIKKELQAVCKHPIESLQSQGQPPMYSHTLNVPTRGGIIATCGICRKEMHRGQI